MKTRLVTACLSLLFVVLYFSVALPHGQPTTGYSMIPDAEADFLVTESIASGGKLYQDFSILYPPGRFILQALLFRLISPSAITSSVLRIALSLVFFPALFFFCMQIVFTYLFSLWKMKDKWIPFASVAAAFSSTFVYLVSIRSAQEIHVLVLLFFLTGLWKAPYSRLQSLLIGASFGLIFLFRFDAGILLSISLLSAYAMQYKKLSLLSRSIFPLLFGGIALVWVPSLLWIMFHGSLFHFLYDTIVLGLIVQPKLMSLPIPQNELGLVFFSTLLFLTGSTLAFMQEVSVIKDRLIRLSLQTFACFAFVSYVAALGRSDEPHLYYGLVWMSFFVIFAGIKLCSWLYFRERLSLVSVIISAGTLAVFAWSTLTLKSPTVFLCFAVMLCFGVAWKRIQPLALILSTLIVSLIVFHSVSYVRLRFSLPKPPGKSEFSFDWISSEGQEVGGVLLQEESKNIVRQIRADIPDSQQYLFIFPTNVMLARYIGMKSPTRYIILGAERTDYTEDEIISDLNRTQTTYFLIFDQKAKDRAGKLWDWIQTNTTLIRQYDFPPASESASLRMRKGA